MKIAARVAAIYTLVKLQVQCYMLLNNERWQNFHGINFHYSSTNHEILTYRENSGYTVAYHGIIRIVDAVGLLQLGSVLSMLAKNMIMPYTEA